jgi:N,N'-diacetyllegionaminate synthase
MTTTIIAEAGVNHNGNVEIAKDLVRAAAGAGADMAKFQSFVADKVVASGVSKADYQLISGPKGESQLDMIKALELSKEDHLVLIEECEKLGITFFSTAFDEQSFDMLAELGCLDVVKVPSGEITNLPLLRHMSRLAKPLLLSTGMADLGEIEIAISVIENAGTSRDLITVLQCTTEYPAPFREVNLKAMQVMGAAFGVRVGYSDHTEGFEASIAAVALGATVVEKHFTLDKSMPGPDHKASLEPLELKGMITAIRNVEDSLGDGIKRPTKSEMKNRVSARRSIIAASSIKAGEAFTKDNLTIKRPGNGIAPKYLDLVIGRSAKRDFQKDELLEL